MLSGTLIHGCFNCGWIIFCLHCFFSVNVDALNANTKHITTPVYSWIHSFQRSKKSPCICLRATPVVQDVKVLHEETVADFNSRLLMIMMACLFPHLYQLR